MAAIRGKDTKPEMIVRRHLHACGFRYRVHKKDLPGTPDITLARYRVVIQVNGCFWHGHDNCPLLRLPASRSAYWAGRLGRNVARDWQNTRALEALAYTVLTVWECELKPAKQGETLRRLTEDIRTASTPSLAELEYQASFM
ncbi:very short patch repair endonuclease [Hymenobacter gummosus]